MPVILSYFIEQFDILDYLEIDNGLLAFQLRDKIYYKHPLLNRDARVDPGLIDLYKPSKVEISSRNTLGERIAGSIKSDNLIGPRGIVGEVFKECDAEMLDVVVVVRRASSKRELERPAEGDFSRFKRCRLATTAPSKIAAPNEYRIIQAVPSERILDDRPAPDRGVPPVALLYEGFGEFQDIYEGYKADPPQDEMQRCKLEEAIDSFAFQMASFFEKELDRQNKGLEYLNKIFSIFNADLPTLAASSIGSVRTDGHFLGKQGEANVITEFKDEAVDVVITAQLSGYDATALKQSLGSNRDKGKLFRVWRVPCLGISIVGPSVSFYAMVFLGGQLRVVALTPAISCIECAGDGKQRQALYAALSAASVLAARIHKDAENPPVNAHKSLYFPAISNLPEYGGRDRRFDFQMTRSLNEGVEHRLLYVAETQEQKTILIKFARTYSIELHDLCAQLGHAPQILGFQRLPGDWYVVAMEYFPSASRLSRASELATYRETWAKQLWTLVRAFHEKGLVHGDLRDPNIVCNGQQVMLLDFDWGGKDGEVTYPTALLCKELMEGRTNNGLKILKEDDARILTKTLNALPGP